MSRKESIIYHQGIYKFNGIATKRYMSTIPPIYFGCKDVEKVILKPLLTSISEYGKNHLIKKDWERAPNFNGEAMNSYDINK